MRYLVLFAMVFGCDGADPVASTDCADKSQFNDRSCLRLFQDENELESSDGAVMLASFDVTVSNRADDCSEVELSSELSELAELCGCENVDGTDCSGDTIQASNEYSYEVYMDGGKISIEIEGQPFASGTMMGCEIEYDSPGWLHAAPDGDVQWTVSSRFMLADGSGACDFDHDYDILGIEEVEIVSSDDVNYPVGRKIRYLVTGSARATGE